MRTAGAGSAPPPGSLGSAMSGLRCVSKVHSTRFVFFTGGGVGGALLADGRVAPRDEPPAVAAANAAMSSAKLPVFGPGVALGGKLVLRRPDLRRPASELLPNSERPSDERLPLSRVRHV